MATRAVLLSAGVDFVFDLMTKSVIVSKLKADTKAMQKSSTNLRLTRLSRLQQSDITVRSRRPCSEFAVQLGDNTMARARDRERGK